MHSRSLLLLEYLHWVFHVAACGRSSFAMRTILSSLHAGGVGGLWCCEVCFPGLTAGAWWERSSAIICLSVKTVNNTSWQVRWSNSPRSLPQQSSHTQTLRTWYLCDNIFVHFVVGKNAVKLFIVKKILCEQSQHKSALSFWCIIYVCVWAIVGIDKIYTITELSWQIYDTHQYKPSCALINCFMVGFLLFSR